MLPFGAVAKKFADAQRLEVWRNNPAKWAEDHGLFMWSKQREVSQSVVDHQKTLVVTSNGVGKATRVSEPLPTPTGWTTMGELRVGDYVLDEQGKPTKVVAKSPVWNIPLVKVVFNDGAEVICPLAHEWAVIHSADFLVYGKTSWDDTVVVETRDLHIGDRIPKANDEPGHWCVIAIQDVPTEPTQCIEVDSPRHLYQVSKWCIPTHNSRLSAMLVNWWVDTHPVDDTTVVTTATNWKQVRNVLWKEIPRVKAATGIRGKVNADATWKIDDRQDPIAFGMKPDDKDESGFQGVHDQYVLVIMDEAGGISKEIFTAADAITTNKFARILAIANPNDPSCYMAEVYKREMRLKPEERSWNIIQFGAYDTPNFTGEVVPVEVATRLVQVDWVEARKKEWGEDDPRFVARVLGEFPDVSDDGLFNMGRVMQSMEAYDTSEPDEGMPITIGVDVARYGSDSSVIVSNQGGYIRIHGRYQGLNGPELARKVGELATEMGAVEIRIDAIGVGASVLDSIYNFVPPTISVVGIHGNAKSGDSTKWYNYRAAMYDQFAKAVADGRVYLPDDDELHNEIASIKYEYRGSALLIESKENMRKRGIKSPDVLDAVIYAYQNIGAIMAGDSEGQYFSPDDLLSAEDFSDFMFEDELAYFIA
nr:MAG TPA: large terminase [Caudoviricetes sp.]